MAVTVKTPLSWPELLGRAGSGVVRFVGPLSLNLPLGGTERDQREVPRALIPVLPSTLVLPRARVVGIRTSFGKVVSDDVGQCRQPLLVQPGSLLRIAACVCVQIEKERDLHAHATT